MNALVEEAGEGRIQDGAERGRASIQDADEGASVAVEHSQPPLGSCPEERWSAAESLRPPNATK